MDRRPARPEARIDPTAAEHRPGYMELLPGTGGSAPTPRRQFNVGVTLLPRFTMVSFAGFVDALRLGADIGDRSQPVACDWRLIGAHTHPVASSNGAQVAHVETFGNPSRFDYVVVVGGLLDDEPCDAALSTFLRRAAEADVTLVGLCTGVFALAEAGVMAGHRTCVHGYHASDFAERFPDLPMVTDRLFVVDGRRITCAGGTAAIDTAAHILATECGPERAYKLLPHLLLEELRDEAHVQAGFSADFFAVTEGEVRAAIFLMQEHLEDPLPIKAISDRLNVPARKLERGFKKAFGQAPSAFYRAMRLKRAHWLLVHSDLSVTQIAFNCGFADTSHLTRSIKRRYGALPTDIRHGTARVAARLPLA